MRLSAPKEVTFWIAVILVVLGILGQLAITALAGFAFWLVVLGFIILALGALLDNF